MSVARLPVGTRQLTDTEAIALGRLLRRCPSDRWGLIAAEVERRWLLHYEFVRTGHGRQLRDRLPLIASVRRDVEAGLL